MNTDVVIFVAGMSRAASMWTYNVVREILKTSGHIPWPEKIPPDEGPAIEHVLRQPAGPGRTWCIKTHQVIPLGQPDVKIICNYRDVRDAFLSFMNFMKYPFKKGQVATQTMMDKTKCDLQTMMDKTDYYLKKPDSNILPVKYDDVTGQPDEVIKHIARFLDLVISDSSVETISRHFAKENVKRRLDKLKSVPLTADGAVANKKYAGDYIGIRNVDGTHRVYDYSTGFQSNHISSNKEGEWKEFFSPEQQIQIEQLTSEWLSRYGLSDG